RASRLREGGFLAGFPSLPVREREYRPDTGQGHFRLSPDEGEEAQVMETDAFSRYIKITLVM
uniref:hypothetical protein n=1 Tax=Parabacteroides goldsteinii TaxID=328812 RepID=UPI00256EB110